MSELVEEAKPGFACGKNPESGVFQLRMNNVTKEGQLDLSKQRRVPKETKRLASYLLEPGDVLFNATNSPDLVGKSAYFDGHLEPVVFSNHFVRIRPRRDVLDGRYLARWLTFQYQRRIFQSMCRQWVNQATVGRDSLLSLMIPLPPLPEQRRIAEVLDRAEALRAKRRAALAQLDELTQSIFHEMIGRRANPIETIGDLLERGALLLHKDGNHGSLYPRSEDFGEDGVPFLSAKSISDDGELISDLVERLKPEKASRLRLGWLQPDDVLLAHNASVGKVATYDGRFNKAIIGTSLTAFRSNRSDLDPAYLAAALRSVAFQRQLEQNMGQTTRNQVPITAQRRLVLPVPSMDTQLAFARRASEVERLKASHRRSLAELDALFASLQDRAFRGEL
ncbi:restriction endonuclease subunit S [Candidatus Laterigemmans baculatus]|uniref:restriction endonuclease subunit S n=1 Tax=Candidatus Laterigemmans baculatus TaxID=2770505 RepID=UPI0013DA552A|nr:restriction endonuclease subunit S [Candidatus Laterigemmans baculatus]